MWVTFVTVRNVPVLRPVKDVGIGKLTEIPSSHITHSIFS